MLILQKKRAVRIAGRLPIPLTSIGWGLLGACPVHLVADCAWASLTTYRRAEPGDPAESEWLEPQQLDLEMPAGSAVLLAVFPRRRPRRTPQPWRPANRG